MTASDLAALVDSHSAGLVLIARQWCATPEDVVQDALLKLIVQNPPPGDSAAWLYRVVRNGAIDAGRKERWQRKHELAMLNGSPWFREPEVDGMDAEAAVAALRKLPAEQREVVIAHIWAGLTFQQIAAGAGCSPSSAHRQFNAAIAALRKELK
jgi:RNA polymerase sigma factor (sigma-70 family)